MKKIISFTIIMGLLFTACQKDVERPNQPKESLASTFPNKNKLTFDTTLHDEIFNWTLYDSCRKENVKFSGLEHYKLFQQSLNDGSFYIYYEIDVTGVVGTADSTGAIYKGDAVVIGTATIQTKFCCYVSSPNRDGTTHIDTIYVANSVIGKTSYDAVFKSAKGDRITLIQKSVYKEINGRIVIQQNDGPVALSCK